jgi:hypothetical protein
MNIQRIGNYTIIKGDKFKQIYSKTRMLQISNNKLYYMDLTKNKLIKLGERILKWTK